jgi:hypothetical protein
MDSSYILATDWNLSSNKLGETSEFFSSHNVMTRGPFNPFKKTFVIGTSNFLHEPIP